MLYVASMRTISPTISGILILLEVVVAAILSFVFLQDALSAYTVAGGAMILLGAFVVTRGEVSIPEPAAGGPSVPQEIGGPDSKASLGPSGPVMARPRRSRSQAEQESSGAE